ncbi:MAG: MarR family winged helix-turn-helix transcriptional regulator [Alphaproteobacteria bacterium]
MGEPRQDTRAGTPAYRLEDQVGFILRQASQRHTALFAKAMPPGLTPTQFAALAKLFQLGPCSQNHLGRLTAMDAATIKGVVERLVRAGLAKTLPDPTDKRRLLADLTKKGHAFAATTIAAAAEVTANTLAPLSKLEQNQFLALLNKLR